MNDKSKNITLKKDELKAAVDCCADIGFIESEFPKEKKSKHSNSALDKPCRSLSRPYN